MASDEYGKLYKRIWGDPDFKGLNESQQLMFIKLFSQSDVSLAGVLTNAPIRWAGQTAGLTERKVENTLRELEAQRYIVVDYDTQEVLIRSFIRQDGGFRSTKTMKGVSNSVRRVLSPKLRREISRELSRIDTSRLPEKVNAGYELTVKAYIEGEIAALIAEYPFDTLSDTPCDTPSDGVFGSRKVDAVLTLTTTPTGTTTNTISASGDDAKGHASGAQYSNQFEQWWKHWPIKSGKKRAYPAFKKALKRASIEEITAGADRYAAWLKANPEQSPKYAEGWLNDDRWTDEINLPGHPTTSDPRQQRIEARRQAGDIPIPPELFEADDPLAWRAWQDAFLAAIGDGADDQQATQHANTQIGR